MDVARVVLVAAGARMTRLRAFAAVALMIVAAAYSGSGRQRHSIDPLDKISPICLREHFRMAIRGDLPDDIARCLVMSISVDGSGSLPRAVEAREVQILHVGKGTVTATRLDAVHWRALLLDPSVTAVRQSANSCASRLDAAGVGPK